MERKPESIEKTVGKVMKRMPDLCQKTYGLEHKRIVATSVTKSIQRLEEELFDAEGLEDEMLQGDVLENVLDYILKD